MNDTQKKALILFIISIILTFIDLFTKYKKCAHDEPKIIPELFLHRAINIFVYFGWIFDNKIVLIFYLLFELCVVIHWFTNNFNCFLAEYENKVCKFDKNTRYDYIFRFFKLRTATVITITLKILVLFIVYYKLFL